MGGKRKKKTSEHQSSWFHRARVNDLCMVQIDPEVSLGVPWHVPRDCSDYHIKKFWSDNLGVRPRIPCFPSQIESDWENKVSGFGHPKCPVKTYWYDNRYNRVESVKKHLKATFGSIWTIQRSLTQSRWNREFWYSEIIFRFLPTTAYVCKLSVFSLAFFPLLCTNHPDLLYHTVYLRKQNL